MTADQAGHDEIVLFTEKPNALLYALEVTRHNLLFWGVAGWRTFWQRPYAKLNASDCNSLTATQIIAPKAGTLSLPAIYSANQGELNMRQMPLVLGLSIAFLLLSAAIAANVGGSSMLEMRGAWVAQALR
jgi:hypothetical protein